MTQQQLIDEYITLPDEAKRQVVDFISFLRQRYGAEQQVHPNQSGELVNEPFIGMWRNRQDLADSADWVRNLRKTEWSENF